MPDTQSPPTASQPFDMKNCAICSRDCPISTLAQRLRRTEMATAAFKAGAEREKTAALALKADAKSRACYDALISAEEDLLTLGMRNFEQWRSLQEAKIATAKILWEGRRGAPCMPRTQGG